MQDRGDYSAFCHRQCMRARPWLHDTVFEIRVITRQSQEHSSAALQRGPQILRGREAVCLVRNASKPAHSHASQNQTRKFLQKPGHGSALCKLIHVDCVITILQQPIARTQQGMDGLWYHMQNTGKIPAKRSTERGPSPAWRVSRLYVTLVSALLSLTSIQPEDLVKADKHCPGIHGTDLEILKPWSHKKVEQARTLAVQVLYTTFVRFQAFTARRRRWAGPLSHTS